MMRLYIWPHCKYPFLYVQHIAIYAHICLYIVLSFDQLVVYYMCNCEWLLIGNWLGRGVFEKTFQPIFLEPRCASQIQRKLQQNTHIEFCETQEKMKFSPLPLPFLIFKFLFIMSPQSHTSISAWSFPVKKVASSSILPMNWCFNQSTLEFRLNHGAMANLNNDKKKYKKCLQRLVSRAPKFFLTMNILPLVDTCAYT